MKKRYIATAVGVVGAGVVTNLMLRNREKRTQYTEESNRHHMLEEAGIPDQMEKEDLTQIENANMVSEGSQYGVNYYNEVKEAEYMGDIQ